MTAHFSPLKPGYPFVELEREILEKWRREDTFHESMKGPAPQGDWVFYEGPPTANNKPHVGHVVTRVVKDLFPRFKTMQGYHVARKAGWDTHGLPVEIEVEKSLGFSGKEQIEAYGIKEFNKACHASVSTYEKMWREMTERVGYWTNMDEPYVTYSNEYIESVWWSLKTLREKGHLSKGYKIQPYCGRCGTTLSSHEVAQNYKDADDPSVWILFPVRSGQEATTLEGKTFDLEGVEFVAWTTTPWTLLAHVGLVMHPELIYRVVEDPRDPSRTILFGDSLETPVPLLLETDGERQQIDLRDLPVKARFRGKDLEGVRYERPFTFFPAPDSDEENAPWRVVMADYVTDTDGTGLVHTAPPFGEDDYRTGEKFGLPFFLAVNSAGEIVEEAGPFAGLWFKDADPPITRNLKERGRLLHGARCQHNYPFCWRCDRPLIYYATESWFVKTTHARDRMVELNRTIHWRPNHIRDGRFGKWLENVVDWALSRNRYWGTPLPVWTCDGCEDVHVIGSFEELFELSGRDRPDSFYQRDQFDPHRPYIDEFTWPCDRCDSGTLRREEDVIDAWYDSGSMPFAQHHYPFENQDQFDRQFPAQFISEAIDQTRGWFYTLHALGVLLFDSVAFEHCVVLGHINDESGRKMSKRLGNVTDPMEVVRDFGADPLRWFFYVSNPEAPSRFSGRLVREAAQRFLLPLWNALSFFVIYANLDGWKPSAEKIPFEDRPALDRWVLLRLDRLTREVTEKLDDYGANDAARSLVAFVEDLTNWYIRRSRDRFWAPTGEGGETKESAYQTLYEVLTTLTRLLAPFIPFLSEVMYQHLVQGHDPKALSSVHLSSWPKSRDDRHEESLEKAMGAVQRIVGLGRSARQTHELKTRQPLKAVTLVTTNTELSSLVEPYTSILLAELNVKEILWAEDATVYVSHEVKPIFPVCGPRFGKKMPLVKKALASANGDDLAEVLEREGKVSVEIDGESVELSSQEVEVKLREREGQATQGDRELLVALSTELTPELQEEGWAREVVHRLQTARKKANLDYAARIRVEFNAAPPLLRAIEAHTDWIVGETLADSLSFTPELTAENRSVEDHEFRFEIYLN